MDVRLGYKFASEVSIFVYFSISKFLFLCASPVTTFLVSTHCLRYRVASLEQFPDSISSYDVNRGYYIYCCFCFFYCFCFFVVLFFVFRDSNMISIGAVEFRYYVVIIILLNLRKP